MADVGSARLSTQMRPAKLFEMGRSVLIVDDDASFREAVSELLRVRGFRIAGCAADQNEAMLAVQGCRPGGILLDAHIAESDNFGIVRRLSGTENPIPVLLTSSDPDAANELLARECGATGFVPKTELVSVDLQRYFSG
jgi:PleD family two-component response regulator